MAYAVGDRSPQDVPAVVGGDSAGVSPGPLLHRLFERLCFCHPMPEQHTTVGKETGETAHVERWNTTLCQRLARFVRMTLSFSRVRDLAGSLSPVLPSSL